MRYAVVTGGTRGIGLQICKDLLRKDYFVITNYSSDDKSAENAWLSFQEYSKKFSIVKFDQSKDNDIEAFVNHIKSIANEIHCLFCNTGITQRKKFDSTTNSDWETVFKVNVHSHFYIIRDLNDLFHKKAKIIFIGSMLGEVPHSLSIAYGVTKAAVHALSKNLVKEFAERKITVNTVAPGFVETEWQNEKPVEIRTNIQNKTALSRFATVNEISQVCMLLLENDFINGTTITVDGGYGFK